MTDIRQPTTNYDHPTDPNLLNIHKAMKFNSDGEPVVRTHVDGISLQGDVIVDTVSLSSSTLTALEHISVSQEGTWTVTVSDGQLVVSNFTSTVNINTMPSVTVSNFTSTVQVSNNVTATITTGTVSVSNFPTTSTVYQGTNPWTITGTVVSSNFTSSVYVINNVTATITGSVTVSNFPTTSTVYQGTTPWLVQTTNTATDVIIADSNYEFNVARGLVDSQYVEMKNGYAPSMASSGPATVWGLNTLYPWSAWTGTGSRLWVASSNPLDVGQQVYIDGLDSNFTRINSTVTLNGTTAVQTVETFYRVNRVYQLTGTTIVGNTSVRVTSSSGTEVGYMLGGNGRQKSGFYTVPAGYTAYILYGDASSYKNGSGNVSGEVDMYTRTNSTSTTMPFLNQFAAVVANGQYRNEFNVPLRIPEKTDIDVRFLPSGNATTVSVNWEMVLIPN